AAAFDTSIGSAGWGSVRGGLFADRIRFGHVAGAGVAQHAFRLVFFRRVFLEWIDRDGSYSDRAARPFGREQLVHESHRHARFWQDGLRVLGVLDIFAVLAVHRNLVRRSAGGNILYRSTGASHAVVAAIGGVPGFDLADSIYRADERTGQKNAGDSRHGGGTGAGRDVARALRAGGSVAVARCDPVWRHATSDIDRFPGRISPVGSAGTKPRRAGRDLGRTGWG